MRISDWSSDVCSSDLRHLGPLSHALLQITYTQLHIGFTRLVAPLAGFHGVVVTRQNTAGAKTGQQQQQREAQGHRDTLLVTVRSVLRDIVGGVQLTHGNVTLTATGAIQHLSYQLATDRKSTRLNSSH